MMQHVVDQYLTQSAGPAKPAVTPRNYRGWLFVAAGILLAVATGVKAYDLLANQPAPAPLAPIVIRPLAVQYVRPDASTRGYSVAVIREFDTHPTIKDDAASKRTIVNLETPNLRLPSTAIRREFAVRCAGCHQPYRGR